uniref:Uncharacterized protein n=1 Tax=Ralstonia solanacearum TaxID=305 RepID=A0A0S4WK68_RALSL|nr:protein of unknown function [Ralstonia solanacearum]
MHACRFPAMPVSRHPPGIGRSERHNEYWPSSLTTTQKSDGASPVLVRFMFAFIKIWKHFRELRMRECL